MGRRDRLQNMASKLFSRGTKELNQAYANTMAVVEPSPWIPQAVSISDAEDIEEFYEGNGVYINAGEVHLQGNPSNNPTLNSIKIACKDFKCKDFDLSAFQEGEKFVWPEYYLRDRIDESIRCYHFDSCIPMLGQGQPNPDIVAINLITTKLSGLASVDSIHPSCIQRLSNSNYLALLAHNCTTLPRNISRLLNLDILYYKMVNGKQHLFLRTSKKMVERNEKFKAAKCTSNIYAQQGRISISANRANLDHVNVLANSVEFKIEEELINRASRLQAYEILYIDAPRQKHETVINRWVRDSGGSRNYVHAEGVQNIDECQLIAPIIVQKGESIDNVGISVDAWCFEDQGIHTINRPAKITLYNHSYTEKRKWFSKRTADMKRWNDVLVPTRYKVNYYKSLDQRGKITSVKFGYTLIDAGSEIVVFKDDKQDIPVPEQHIVEIHESSSGFSVFGLGRAGNPNPMAQLKAIHKSYQNMIGLTTSTISAVAKTIRAYEDFNDLKTKIDTISDFNLTNMMHIMSRFIQGPSLQLGRRSVSVRLKESKSHGNYMKAKRMIFRNANLSTFGGFYDAEEDIGIKTKTLITFALPHTMHSRVSMHQTGLHIDLLNFALACMNPQMSSITSTLLSSSSVRVASQNTETHCVQNIPTKIQAGGNLRIEAENGYLTQAQIKAAIVHAVFTNDLVLQTLANEKWTTQKGYSISFSGLADVMKDGVKGVARSTTLSVTDAGNFEGIIDDFARLVGTEDFYLKVGHILKTESAFFGHKNHDPAKEHIKCKEIQENHIKKLKKNWNNSFSISISDLVKVANEIKKLCFDHSISQGISPEEANELANQKSEQEIEELTEDLQEIDQILEDIDDESRENLKKRIKPVPTEASKEEKKHIEEENKKIIEEEVRKSAENKKNVLSLYLIKKLQGKHPTEEKQLSDEISDEIIDKNRIEEKQEITPIKSEDDQQLDHFARKRVLRRKVLSYRHRHRAARDYKREGPKIDPNTINWETLSEKTKIKCADIDWDKVQTTDHAAKIDFSKVDLPLFGPPEIIPDRVFKLMFRAAREKIENRKPSLSDVINFTEKSISDAVSDAVFTSADIVCGLWKYAKHVCDNPRAAIHEAGEYINEWCQRLKEYVVKEGTSTLESIEVIRNNPNLFQAELRNIANNPENFVKKLMETDGWKFARLHPAFATTDLVGGTYFDLKDSFKSCKNLKEAIHNLRDRAVSSCISGVANFVGGQPCQISADVLMNFH